MVVNPAKNNSIQVKILSISGQYSDKRWLIDKAVGSPCHYRVKVNYSDNSDLSDFLYKHQSVTIIRRL